MRLDNKQTYRKLCRRWNRPHQAHYLTFTCFHGRPFLSRDRTRNWMIEAITAAIAELHFDLWAWVLMPEHVHLIVYPRDEVYSISDLLKAIKQPVAQRAAGWVKRNAPGFLEHMRDEQPNGVVAYRFWQRGGGHDRNLYSTEEVWEKIQYTHNNPVRRELVGAAVDWPWSSAKDYAGVGKGPLTIGSEFLPMI